MVHGEALWLANANTGSIDWSEISPDESWDVVSSRAEVVADRDLLELLPDRQFPIRARWFSGELPLVPIHHSAIQSFGRGGPGPDRETDTLGLVVCEGQVVGEID